MNELTSKANILVLYAGTYNITDETTRETNSGCSVHYLFWGEHGENLVPQSDADVSKPVGFQRAKASLDPAVREKIMIAPAIYQGEFTMKVGSDGKPVLKLVDVSYVCNVNMSEHVIPGLVVPGMVPRESESPKK